MAIQGTATTEIDAPLARVYEVAADAAGAPRWQPELKSSEVLEANEAGEQTLVKYKVDLKVKTVDVVMAFAYDPPGGLSWKQQSGALKAVEGRWELEDLGGDRTRATYHLMVDLGKLGLVVRGPLVGVLRHELAETMPGKLKAFVEAQG